MPNMTTPPQSRICARTPRTRNILDVYAAATVAELVEGLSWYEEAHHAARRLDPLNPGRAAGVLAALSPRTDWKRNLELAHLAYRDRRASAHMRMCTVPANRILNGERPLDVLAGPKVRAFFACIDDPASQEVVVDRHAFDIAVGRVTNETTRNSLDRVGQYQRFAHHYVLAAKQLDLLPSQVQAVTWLVFRRMKLEALASGAISTNPGQAVLVPARIR